MNIGIKNVNEIIMFQEIKLIGLNSKLDRIPKKLRPLFVKYIEELQRYKNYSIKTIETDIMKSLEIFLNFISDRFPTWTGLENLNRIHIELFLYYLNNKYGQLQQKDRVYLQIIRKFLHHICIFEFSEAPKIDANLLLSEDDIPKKYYKSRKTSTIPREILKQLDSNIKCITPEVDRDIVFIARTTGISVADVINLKVENCLKKVNNSYFMVTDIKRTNKKNYSVPITEDVVELLKKRIGNAIALGIDTGKLFFYSDSKAEITTSSVVKSLNNMSRDKGIVYLGKAFKFNAHMLRETKALEYIDAGVDIHIVQQLLGYSTTKNLVEYKKAKDNNLRKQWEATNDAISRRREFQFGKKQIRTFTENGECKSIDVKDCFRRLNPCLSCRCFYITSEFIDEYKAEINRLELFIEKYINDDTIVNIDEHVALLKVLKEVLNKIEKNK